MQFTANVTVTCPECKTQYVPNVLEERLRPAASPTGPGQVTIEVIVSPHCPTCDALYHLLVSAGRGKLAGRLAQS